MPLTEITFLHLRILKNDIDIFYIKNKLAIYHLSDDNPKINNNVATGTIAKILHASLLNIIHF